MSGRAESWNVSAIGVLAARESRHKERTASLSHRITRDDMTVVLDSANRRLTELADPALRTTMWRSARALPMLLIRWPPARPRSRAGDLLGARVTSTIRLRAHTVLCSLAQRG